MECDAEWVIQEHWFDCSTQCITLGMGHRLIERDAEWHAVHNLRRGPVMEPYTRWLTMPNPRRGPTSHGAKDRVGDLET
eukprot:1160261-Pelagomonas_calceolata.AAC.19